MIIISYIKGIHCADALSNLENCQNLDQIILSGNPITKNADEMKKLIRYNTKSCELQAPSTLKVQYINGTDKETCD